MGHRSLARNHPAQYPSVLAVSFALSIRGSLYSTVRFQQSGSTTHCSISQATFLHASSFSHYPSNFTRFWLWLFQLSSAFLQPPVNLGRTELFHLLTESPEWIEWLMQICSSWGRLLTMREEQGRKPLEKSVQVIHRRRALLAGMRWSRPEVRDSWPSSSFKVELLRRQGSFFWCQLQTERLEIWLHWWVYALMVSSWDQKGVFVQCEPSWSLWGQLRRISRIASVA